MTPWRSWSCAEFWQTDERRVRGVNAESAIILLDLLANDDEERDTSRIDLYNNESVRASIWRDEGDAPAQ